nr:hypothetical protein [uncultured Amphritea sp.]
MNVPIIYSPHKMGLKNNSLDCLFVPLSFSSTVKSNPDTNVYFLNVNDNYSVSTPGIIDVDVRGFYSKACGPIRKSYKHLSTNQPDFELFCMERFFVIKEFMKKEKIDKAFLVETDVLIFENLNDFLNAEGGIDSSKNYLSERKCISFGFITISYLEYYCDFITDCYNDDEKFNKIKAYYQRYREKGNSGGICDMTFCDYINNGAYGAKKEYKVSNISDFFCSESGDVSVFDSFIGRDFILNYEKKIIMTESYIDNKRIKKVVVSGGKPFIKFTDGSSVKLASLHCQGNAKKLMSDYYVNYII